jgi:hypothetical protein
MATSGCAVRALLIALARAQLESQATRISRLVVFPLVYELSTALVVTEDFTVQVKAGYNCADAFEETVAVLRIDLQMSKGEDIAGRTRWQRRLLRHGYVLFERSILAS